MLFYGLNPSIYSCGSSNESGSHAIDSDVLYIGIEVKLPSGFEKKKKTLGLFSQSSYQMKDPTELYKTLTTDI